MRQLVPDVHRLHARERQLTSEISEAQYLEESHRQSLQSEIARLKSAMQNSKTDLESNLIDQ